LVEALQIVRGFGVQRVLVTCGENNAASRKVIEKCGGVLENIIDTEDGERVRRYWLE